MAFSKMAGFAVTPRIPSSSAMRLSSPDLMSLRPIKSSQALCPNSFNLAAGFIFSAPLPGGRARAFQKPFRDAAGDLLRSEIVGLGQRLLRSAGAEAVDSDDQPVADDAVPVEAERRFDRDELRLATRQKGALLVA